MLLIQGELMPENVQLISVMPTKFYCKMVHVEFVQHTHIGKMRGIVDMILVMQTKFCWKLEDVLSVHHTQGELIQELVQDKPVVLIKSRKRMVLALLVLLTPEESMLEHVLLTSVTKSQFYCKMVHV